MIFGANRLRFESVANFLERRRGMLCVVLCFVWIVAGLTGREPWKPDEALVFGVIHQMLGTGDVVVPALAGEPFLRFPPLYYATAAISGLAFSPFLPLHDAARLVNVAWIGITLLLLAATVRRLHGPGRAWLVPLITIGCVGIVQPAHLLVPDNALMLGFALSAYGLALCGEGRVAGAIALGTGLGIAFLSRGILGAAAIVLAYALLSAAPTPLRARAALRLWPITLAVALPWLAAWPLLLEARDPALLQEWLAVHEFGRYRFDQPGAGHGTALYYLKVLPWFAWPVFPFALWTLWCHRSELLGRIEFAMPLALLLTMLALLSTSHDKRELFALPLLVPLALLAIAGIGDLRRGALNAFFWFAIAFFLFLLPVIWFYWVAAEFGMPARLARHLARMEPGYVPSVSVVAMVFAAAVTLLWIVALFNIRRSPERPFMVWAVGATAFWVVLMTLMIGFLDNAKSYRGMMASLGRALPAQRGCVASLALGESQRALLHYYLGLVTERIENGVHGDKCALMLVEGNRTEGLMDAPWRLAWEGHRPGDSRERLRLYARDPSSAREDGRSRR